MSLKGGASDGYMPLPASAPPPPELPLRPPRGGPPPPGLFGSPGIIDAGFEHVEDFDRGTIDFREGVDQAILDLSSLQGPLPLQRKLASVALGMAAAATGVGLFYLAGKLTLVRKGEIGVVEAIDGTLRVLDAGYHLIETVGASVTKAHLSQDLISHGALKIIRILPGDVGLALQNGRAVVLLPGRHLIIDPCFVFVRSESVLSPHISHGTVHLITVRVGQVGLATVDSTAHFLEPGRHNINSTRFTFHGFRNVTDEHISIGSKHRIVVPQGKVGLGWERGAAKLLDPGMVHCIDSPFWSYSGSRHVTEPVIRHGGMTMVIVKQGSVAITFEDGVLTILSPGRHVLTKATHVHSGFLSMGQHVMSISELYSMTSDNLGVKFDAAITVRVVDPRLAVSMLCTIPDDTNVFTPASLFKTIVDKSKLSLSIIIGNSRLNRVFRATARTGSSSAPVREPTKYGQLAQASEDPAEEASSSFKQNVHDVFMAAFHESMLVQCGVEVVDMSIEDITVVNAELSQAMAQGAVASAELSKAQIQMQIVTAQATAEQTQTVILAEGRARAIAIIAEADANRIRVLDEAMSKASPLTAQRELIRASGEVLSESKSSVILARSIADVSSMLGNGNGGIGSMLNK